MYFSEVQRYTMHLNLRALDFIGDSAVTEQYIHEQPPSSLRNTTRLAQCNSWKRNPQKGWSTQQCQSMLFHPFETILLSKWHQSSSSSCCLLQLWQLLHRIISTLDV